MLAVLVVAWQRRRMVRHLIGVAAENEARRRQLAAEFGTAVADREFATGEAQVWAAPAEEGSSGWAGPRPSPPPKPSAPHPRVRSLRPRPEED
jgi:hypothetical protein